MSRRASSIKPGPISTRPTRPTAVSLREMNSTTPTKMNNGDSHDKSSENTTAITLVPAIRAQHHGQRGRQPHQSLAHK